MKTIGNASLLKDLNKSIIINIIKDKGPISRADLVNITKLALPTVLRNVNQLILEGIVIEIGKGDTSYGRKPIMLDINPDLGFLFGIKVGGRLVVILTDFRGNILDQTIDITQDKEGPAGIVNQIKKILFKMVADKSIPLEKIAGIGVATPGSGFKTGTLINSSCFAGWENTDFGKLLKDSIPDIPILTEYTTICSVIGEQWFGDVKNVNNCVHIYADAGVGGAFIIDGRVYRGKDGYAGHLGHHVINYDGELCYCGNRGCLEAYTSTVSIIRKVKKVIEDGGQSAIIGKAGLDKLDFQKIINAYEKGDRLATDILLDAGKMLGIGIANLINIYNPDTILLGGEVCCSCPALVEEAMNTAMQNTFLIKAKDIRVVVSKMGQYSEALGAIALVLREIYKMPEV